MNNTAHCFLSFANDDLLLGNFIGDFVKGKAWERYPVGVQQGILLHRAIDSFTDNHPATRQSVGRIRSFAGRYAPPVVDILYDHLLCKNWQVVSETDFDEFASWTYDCLQNRVAEMPPVLQKRLPQMLAGRFLHGYQTREGLEWVLSQFARRLHGKADLVALSEFFFANIDLFSDDFKAFFPDLQALVQVQRAEV
jgi:acyl carrier protein phosphodiesterase